MGIWALIGLLMFVFGFFIVFYALKTGKKQPKRVAHSATTATKDGLPLTPRDARRLEHQQLPSPPTLSAPIINADTAMADKITISTTSSPSPNSTLQQTTPPNPENKNDVPVRQTQFEQTVASFDDEASLLDPYFQDNANDTLRNHEALLAQKATITLFLTPRDHSADISGNTLLQLAQHYGLKYGVLNMFHRYEHPEGRGMLWFSMLGVGIDGLQSFDLIEMPSANYRGLAFFLSLPHPNALAGFDSMTQIAYAIADELDADIHDEEGYFIDQKQLQQLKSDAIHYAS